MDGWLDSQWIVPKDEITFHGLHGWYKHIFEHLGWMVLCSRKNTCKTKRIAYVMSIDKYMEMATYKIGKLSGSEKDDANILLANIRLLRQNIESMVGITANDINNVRNITGGNITGGKIDDKAELSGGAKKKSSKKSKKSSKKSSKKGSRKGSKKTMKSKAW